MANEKGVVYTDLDGTLAEYNGWIGYDHIGAPIPAAISLIKDFLNTGYNVKIFTARANEQKAIPIIQTWVKEHIGVDLEITNIKGFDATIILDDRAFRIMRNTGQPCCVGSTIALNLMKNA